jgi:hypothetical protein
MRNLTLGNGLRPRENFISIDIDPRNVFHVRIQPTNPITKESCISEQSSELTVGTETLMGALIEKPYAIVPNSLPAISDLDAWGRQDIVQQASKWPDNLEAAYDLFFQTYCRTTPSLPCVSGDDKVI